MIACTDPNGARHENLSWFMIDANLPGITVQPMELMGTGGEGGDGQRRQKNTVFFDNVRVPAFALVGGENKGWTAASTHLELEHGGGGRIGRNRAVGAPAPLLPGDQARRRAAQPSSRTCATCSPTSTSRARSAAVRPAQLLAHVRAAAALLRGPAALLLPEDGRPLDDRRDPGGGRPGRAHHRSTWGSPDGFLETQQRNGIVAVHPGGTADIQRVSMARRIGIGRTGAKPRARH